MSADPDPRALFSLAAEVASDPTGSTRDEAAWTEARRVAAKLVTLAPKTLLEHLDEALLADDTPARLDALSELGILAVLLPEVEALRGFHESSEAHHKDLWDHTTRVVANMPPDADLRWAALLHDVGKVATRVVDARGKVTFWRHEPVSGWLARGIFARVQMPASRLERVVFIIEHHARVNAYLPEWSDRAVRRLMRDSGPGLDDLIAFSSGDFTTKRTRRQAQILARLAELERRVEALRHQEVRVLPRGLGEALIEAGIPRGPEVGEAMRWLEAEARAGRLPAGAAPRIYLEAWASRQTRIVHETSSETKEAQG